MTGFGSGDTRPASTTNRTSPLWESDPQSSRSTRPQTLGIRNLLFIRYEGKPAAPFDEYYTPLKKLDRVYWSLVGAGGATSSEEREHVFRLAEANENLAGFILDDFFHESTEDGLSIGSRRNARFPVRAISCRDSIWFKPLGPVAIIERAISRWTCRPMARSSKKLPEVRCQFTYRDGQCGAEEPWKRCRPLCTHDAAGAISCGLAGLRLHQAAGQVDCSGWKAVASSTYPGFDAASLNGVTRPFRASLTPEELNNLRRRQVRGTKLPVMAVVYTNQISPRESSHRSS